MSRHNRHTLSPAPSSIPAQAVVSDMIDSAMVPPRAGMARKAAVKQMAEDMRQAGHREGGVTDRDLHLLGWTREQVEALAPDANIHAQQLAGASA